MVSTHKTNNSFLGSQDQPFDVILVYPDGKRELQTVLYVEFVASDRKLDTTDCEPEPEPEAPQPPKKIYPCTRVPAPVAHIKQLINTYGYVEVYVMPVGGAQTVKARATGVASRAMNPRWTCSGTARTSSDGPSTSG